MVRERHVPGGHHERRLQTRDQLHDVRVDALGGFAAVPRSRFQGSRFWLRDQSFGWWSGPRILENIMQRLWVRALVAFAAMDLALAGGAAARVALGFSSGREFGGAMGTGIFVAFVATGYCAGALAGAILPAADLIR